VLSVDLTLPIVVLCIAAAIVLAARAYAAWAERAIETRTEALLARFGLRPGRDTRPEDAPDDLDPRA
jgi:hypothetical protein